MAGPKNPEQLRGALGAFRRRLMEAERPKEPTLDLRVDPGLDPSKAPVPVSPRFQAPMIPEEPELPPTSSGVYKGVEDIAERLINTPTDRRSFMRGTGQAINALKFMNSPLAKIGNLLDSPAAEAPKFLPRNEALVEAVRIALQEADLPKRFTFNLDDLPINEKGEIDTAGRYQGSIMQDALHVLFDDYTRGDSPYYEIIKKTMPLDFAKSIQDRLDQEFERLSGQKFDGQDVDGKALSSIIRKLGEETKNYYEDYGSLHSSGNLSDLKRFRDQYGKEPHDGSRRWVMEHKLKSLRRQNPDWTPDEVYHAFSFNDDNYDDGKLGILFRRIVKDPDSKEALRQFFGEQSGWRSDVPYPTEDQKARLFEQMKKSVASDDASASLRDVLMPNFRKLFDETWERITPEVEADLARYEENQRRMKSGGY